MDGPWQKVTDPTDPTENLSDCQLLARSAWSNVLRARVEMAQQQQHTFNPIFNPPLREAGWTIPLDSVSVRFVNYNVAMDNVYDQDVTFIVYSFP